MYFGSKYVYKYEHSSDESVSDDDEEIVLNEAPVVVAAAAALPLAIRESKESGKDAASGAASRVARRKKHLRKADTNVLSVRFNRLLQPGEMHAGDPVYCAECGAIASHLSKIHSEENQESKWQCDFCSKLNTVDIEQTDLPKQEDATYLVTPAPAVHGSDMTGIDDSIVIFLIDVSGSMSSTTLVQGTFRLPNAMKQHERNAANFDGEPMIRQRNQTYVSRLQGVQMAVDANLDTLVKDTPTRRAALLTFNHEITYYGDGTRGEPLVIRGDKLNNAEDLIREAERELNNELKAVSETKANLTERVYDLEEGGQTALGPAVMFALNIASKRPGSKLVICTDGLANRGLGNLEPAQDEKADEATKMQALSDGNHFYAGLTEHAREKGVSISVITIKGTTCLLPVIGQMADGTGSNVTIVDLLNIRDEFASVLEQKVIATNVEATLIVHRGLYIRNPEDPIDKLEKIKRTIGNVTKQTEVSFEFGMRNKQELKEKFNIDLDQLKQLPFQVQVIYTAADGSKALRVLTQLKETTENREVAEVNAFRGVIAENHIRSTATEMMVDFDEEEDDDDAPRMQSKWSRPVMQKQRMLYMDNLNARKRSNRTYETDHFSETQWNKTSGELKSHVVTSNARKTAAFKSVAAPTSSASPSVLGRISNALFGSSTKDEEESGTSTKGKKSDQSKRSYGFDTRNLLLHSDKSSEDLYRYKKFSSDHMRTSSPTREEEEEKSNTGKFSVAKRDSDKDESDDDDESPAASSSKGRQRRSKK